MKKKPIAKKPAARKAPKKAPRTTAAHATHGGHGSNNSQVKPPIKEFIQSPNRSSRNGAVIDRIVVHCTEASLQSTINTFLGAGGAVTSAHYVIDRNGDIYQMVSDSERANHCKGANAPSIGIEHVALIDQAIAPAQGAASVALLNWLKEQYDVPRSRIFGHDFTPDYTGDTSCPDVLFGGGHTQAAVQAWMAANGVNLP